MMVGHITLFGLAEIVLTVVVLAFVEKVSPAALDNVPEKSSFKPLYILIGALIVLTPIGLLATGTAWGEWGVDEMATLSWDILRLVWRVDLSFQHCSQIIR